MLEEYEVQGISTYFVIHWPVLLVSITNSRNITVFLSQESWPPVRWPSRFTSKLLVSTGEGMCSSSLFRPVHISHDEVHVWTGHIKKFVMICIYNPPASQFFGCSPETFHSELSPLGRQWPVDTAHRTVSCSSLRLFCSSVRFSSHRFSSVQFSSV